MNYKKIYDALIEKRKSQKLDNKQYTELHHVIPRGEGGIDDESNLVRLLPREHFIAHWLLYRDNPKSSSRAFAFQMMCTTRLGIYKVSSRAYAEGKMACSKAFTEVRTGSKFIIHPETLAVKRVRPFELDWYFEQGWKLGRIEDTTLRHWINNGDKEKYFPVEKSIPIGWHIGRLGSTTQGKKALNLNGETVFVEENVVDRYLNMGYSLGIGRHNAPWKALKGKTLTCPHCNKIGGFQGMKVHHFDNCKLKNYEH